MMFHKDSKTAFVMPPKTGTTSLFDYLQFLNFKVLPDRQGLGSRHDLPENFLKIYPVLNEYRFYGFFRDPLDRFISFISMFRAQEKPINFKKLMTDLAPKGKVLGLRQVDWLNCPNITVLDFDNFKEEVRQIGQMYGREDLPVPKMNVAVERIAVTDEMKEFVRTVYDEDYRFGKQVLGKEYSL